jgi:hypothetical protein
MVRDLRSYPPGGRRAPPTIDLNKPNRKAMRFD